MAFGYEKRDVYRATIGHVGWKSTGRITSDPDTDTDPERMP